jgi:hypothetical protein
MRVALFLSGGVRRRSARCSVRKKFAHTHSVVKCVTCVRTAQPSYSYTTGKQSVSGLKLAAARVQAIASPARCSFVYCTCTAYSYHGYYTVL